MPESTSRHLSRKSKPQNPYAEYPLFPHLTGRWAKSIRQKLHDFGKTANDSKGSAALEQFQREWPCLSEGRTPPPTNAGQFCTLKDLCSAFLTSKRNQVVAGELSQRSFADYHRTTVLLIGQFRKDRRVDDLRPDDFERLRKSMARRLGPVSLKNEINRIRVVFKYAYDNDLIDREVKYGQSFNRPSAKMLRKARNEAGPRLFERDEVLRILDALDGKPVSVEGAEEPVTLSGDPALKAMILLGLNCGFGNTDVASLPQSAVDLDSGWVEFPRPKTEIHRRVPLWAETVEAIREAIAQRPNPKLRADSDLCFITIQGNRWVRTKQKQSSDDPNRYVTVNTVGARFRRLLEKLNINGRRGLGFYTLRHVFETIGGESRDQVAVNAIMGHVDNSMAAVYRERISDERLRAVVQTVHAWLWPDRS